jgi:uncharacterized membrane protein YsdA (DUF1294 family)/cold shock CspA family protein
MAIQGTISRWHEKSGYGFITADDQQAQIKFHLHDLDSYGQPPRISERVQFHLSQDDHGELRAVNVERTAIVNFTLAIAVWFSTVLIGSAVLLDFSNVGLALYIVTSFLSYTLYALDKQALHNNSWRIPTVAFHLVSLSGGWVGALLAQSVLHHKYNDVGFKWVFWLTVIANFALFCFSLTEAGELWLTEFIHQIRAMY